MLLSPPCDTRCFKLFQISSGLVEGGGRSKGFRDYVRDFDSITVSKNMHKTVC